MRILLVTPPLTQLNTPYPATPGLTAFLRRLGAEVQQMDLGLETALALFSRAGLSAAFEAIGQRPSQTPASRFAMDHAEAYIDSIDTVVRFLQGRDGTAAYRICARDLLPEGPRFESLDADQTAWAFGTFGLTDRARHLATLYLDDLVDLLRETIAPHFALSRYAPQLATAATSFDPLAQALRQPPDLIDGLLETQLHQALERHQPELVGFTVPFPGNLYGALRAAALVKRWCPSTWTVAGGGYINTELRTLREPRVFQYLDFVTLDDGERPMQCLLEHLAGERPREALKRTFCLQASQVRYVDGALEPDIHHGDKPTPTYGGLPLSRYLSVLEVLNPMHRLWSDGTWLKLTVAHGCYWKRCAFCDISLDYIGRYQSAPAAHLVDQMEVLMAETGLSGFHLVDEAAPPLALRDLSLELLRRGLITTWWTNIRFEKTFSPDLCRLLAAAGCIAVSGGLEVASDRLLKRMQKGVTVPQVARVASRFTQAGILVHAYLMYGFPTQTVQETIDSLERVRQLFQAGVLQSAFWHRFIATAHAPIGRDPSAYGIQIVGPNRGDFAWNDLEHQDPSGADHSLLEAGLERALHHFMIGEGLETPVEDWFDMPVPSISVPSSAIETALADPSGDGRGARNRRVVWLGRAVAPPSGSESPSGAGLRSLRLLGHFRDATLRLPMDRAHWLRQLLNGVRPNGRPDVPYPLLDEVLRSFPDGDLEEVRRFLRSQSWLELREAGLLLL